jgi:hypothetical protein
VKKNTKNSERMHSEACKNSIKIPKNSSLQVSKALYLQIRSNNNILYNIHNKISFVQHGKRRKENVQTLK